MRPMLKGEVVDMGRIGEERMPTFDEAKSNYVRTLNSIFGTTHLVDHIKELRVERDVADAKHTNGRHYVFPVSSGAQVQAELERRFVNLPRTPKGLSEGYDVKPVPREDTLAGFSYKPMRTNGRRL